MAGEIIINCGAAKVAGLRFEGQPWSQEKVTTIWLAMGYPEPAPLVPKSLIGWIHIPTRAGRMLGLPGGPGGKAAKGSQRGVTKEENKFLNFWGQAVTDPCRKQSGISKIAGGILQVASVFFPQLAYMQAVATAANTVADVQREKALVKSGTELLTAAAQEQARAQLAPPVSVAPLTALAPPVVSAPPLNVAPLAMAPMPGFVDPWATPPPAPAARRRKLTPRDYAILAGVGVGLYLLLRRIRQR